MSVFKKKKTIARGLGKRKNVALKPASKLPRREDDEDNIDDEFSSYEEDENTARMVEKERLEEEMTVEQKKLRMAKMYLEQMTRGQEDEKASDDEQDFRLKRLKSRFQMSEPIIDWTEFETEGISVSLKNQHRLPVTRLILSSDGTFLISSSKDGSLVKWSMTPDSGVGKRLLKVPNAHTKAILAVALSLDSKFLATGCEGGFVNIWDPAKLEKLHSFNLNRHRNKVTGLAFRYGTHQLYSCSADRSVKVWSLDEMAYMETLFGHEDVVTSIDNYFKDRALTSGGRDGTIRLWKIAEESHLIFPGDGTSVECTIMLNEDTFVSGHDDGRIHLWKAMKKKSVFNLSVSSSWITALTSWRDTNIIGCGSSSGKIVIVGVLNAAKSSSGRPTLEIKLQIPCAGFVNSLQFSGKFLLAACSQEHALGRWERIKEAKNSIIVFPLFPKKNFSTNAGAAHNIGNE